MPHRRTLQEYSTRKGKFLCLALKPTNKICKMNRLLVLLVPVILVVTPSCASECTRAKDSKVSLELLNNQILEDARKGWALEKQYTANNSTWNNSNNLHIKNVRQIWLDFDSYYRDNFGPEFEKNRDLISRIIVNNQRCFDPITVAEAEQILSG